jgi:large subunit ribosomal protein L6
MSRLAKKPIIIPEDVEVSISGNEVKAKGPNGENSLALPDLLGITKNKNEIMLERAKKTKHSKELIGTYHSLINNLIIGVKEGHKKSLIYKGVGYQAIASNNKLTLKIGYSHEVEIEAPKEIKFEVKKDKIIVSGIDKQLVGEFAARVRSARPVEPYKLKGIKYTDEQITQKEGKAVEKMGEEK